jgi:tyrosine-protein kinase Etk/Wzc
MVLCFIVVVMYQAFNTFSQDDIYQSSASIRALKSRKSTDNPLSVIPEFEGVGQDRTIGNELHILKSHSLAEDVARRLIDTVRSGVVAPEALPIVKGQIEPGRKGKLLRSLGLTEIAKSLGLYSEPPMSERPYASVDAVAGRVLGTAIIQQVRGIDVITIAAESTSPEEAMLVANTIAIAYYYRNLRSAREATTLAREFLENQLHEKKAELDTSENELRRYQQKEGIVALDDESRSVIEQLSTFEAELNGTNIALASSEKVLESYKRQLAEQEPNLAKNISDAIADPYIKTLQTQIAELQIQRDLATAQRAVSQEGKEEYFQDLFAKSLGEVNQKIKTLQDKLKQKTDELIKSNLAVSSPIESIRELTQKVIAQQIEISALQAKSSAISQIVKKYSDRFGKIPEKNIRFAQFERERKSNEKLYLMVQEKYQEALITEQSQYGNVELIDPARLPGGPVRPNRMTNMLVGILAGLGLGIGIALLMSFMDTTIRSPDDIEQNGFTALGFVPPFFTHGDHEPGESLVALNPRSSGSEGYRMLRTSIQNFLNGQEQGKILVISSPVPREGKSTTTANLAVSLARAEYRTLLIDSDLRRPSLHKIFSAKLEPGLADYLAGKVDLDTIIRETSVGNLRFISCGSIPEDPSELLTSHKMKDLIGTLKKRFDIIVLDTTPLVTIADAQIVAKQSDGVVLVVSAGMSKMAGLEKARAILDQLGVRLFGVLLNKFDLKHSYGHYYRYYYQYDYYYSEDGTGKKVKRKKRRSSPGDDKIPYIDP